MWGDPELFCPNSYVSTFLTQQFRVNESSISLMLFHPVQFEVLQSGHADAERLFPHLGVHGVGGDIVN